MDTIISVYLVYLSVKLDKDFGDWKDNTSAILLKYVPMVVGFITFYTQHTSKFSYLTAKVSTLTQYISALIGG